MLQGLLLMTGFMIMRLVYGKEEYDKRWATRDQFSVGIQVSLSLATVFWIMSFVFAGISHGGERIFCLVYAVLYPSAIIVWTIVTRLRIKNGTLPEPDVDTDNKYIPPTYASDLGAPTFSFETAIDSLAAPASSSKDKAAVKGRAAAYRILTVSLTLDRKTHPGEAPSVSRILTASGALSAWAEKHLGQDRTVTNSVGSSLTAALYPDDVTSQAIARGIFYRAAEAMGITLTAFDGTNLKSAFIPRFKTMLELTSGECDFIISSSLDALDALYDGKTPSLDFPGLHTCAVPSPVETPAVLTQPMEPSGPTFAQSEKEPEPAQRTPTERWYTCPYCGQLVREGQECDCRKLLRAAAQIRPDVYDRETSPAHADELDAAARKPEKKRRTSKSAIFWIACLGTLCLALTVTVGILAYSLYDRVEYIDYLAEEIEYIKEEVDTLYNERQALQKTVDEQEETISALQRDVEKAKPANAFLTIGGGVTVSNDTVYFHTPSCSAVTNMPSTSTFNFFSVKVLFNFGYIPDPDCHSPEEIDAIYKFLELS